MPVFAKIDYTVTGSVNPPIGGTMDSPRISADVSGKPRIGVHVLRRVSLRRRCGPGFDRPKYGTSSLNADKRLRRIGLLPR